MTSRNESLLDPAYSEIMAELHMMDPNMTAEIMALPPEERVRAILSLFLCQTYHLFRGEATLCYSLDCFSFVL